MILYQIFIQMIQDQCYIFSPRQQRQYEKLNHSLHKKSIQPFRAQNKDFENFFRTIIDNSIMKLPDKNQYSSEYPEKICKQIIGDDEMAPLYGILQQYIRSSPKDKIKRVVQNSQKAIKQLAASPKLDWVKLQSTKQGSYQTYVLKINLDKSRQKNIKTIFEKQKYTNPYKMADDVKSQIKKAFNPTEANEISQATLLIFYLLAYIKQKHYNQSSKISSKDKNDKYLPSQFSLQIQSGDENDKSYELQVIFRFKAQVLNKNLHQYDNQIKKYCKQQKIQDHFYVENSLYQIKKKDKISRSLSLQQDYHGVQYTLELEVQQTNQQTVYSNFYFCKKQIQIRQNKDKNKIAEFKNTSKNRSIEKLIGEIKYLQFDKKLRYRLYNSWQMPYQQHLSGLKGIALPLDQFITRDLLDKQKLLSIYPIKTETLYQFMKRVTKDEKYSLKLSEIVFEIYQQIFNLLSLLHGKIGERYPQKFSKIQQKIENISQINNSSGECKIFHSKINSLNIKVECQNINEPTSIDIYLSDFDSSCVERPSRQIMSMLETQLSNKSFNLKNSYQSCKGDLEAVGRILFQHLTKLSYSDLFKQPTNHKTREEIITKKMKQQNICQQWIQIVSSCLDQDDNDMKSAQQIVLFMNKNQFKLKFNGFNQYLAIRKGLLYAVQIKGQNIQITTEEINQNNSKCTEKQHLIYFKNLENQNNISFCNRNIVTIMMISHNLKVKDSNKYEFVIKINRETQQIFLYAIFMQNFNTNLQTIWLNYSKRENKQQWQIFSNKQMNCYKQNTLISFFLGFTISKNDHNSSIKLFKHQDNQRHENSQLILDYPINFIEQKFDLNIRGYLFKTKIQQTDVLGFIQSLKILIKYLKNKRPLRIELNQKSFQKTTNLVCLFEIQPSSPMITLRIFIRQVARIVTQFSKFFFELEAKNHINEQLNNLCQIMNMTLDIKIKMNLLIRSLSISNYFELLKSYSSIISKAQCLSLYLQRWDGKLKAQLLSNRQIKKYSSQQKYFQKEYKELIALFFIGKKQTERLYWSDWTKKCIQAIQNVKKIITNIKKDAKYYEQISAQMDILNNVL